MAEAQSVGSDIVQLLLRALQMQRQQMRRDLRWMNGSLEWMFLAFNWLLSSCLAAALPLAGILRCLCEE